jgi:hypothetical protein
VTGKLKEVRGKKRRCVFVHTELDLKAEDQCAFDPEGAVARREKEEKGLRTPKGDASVERAEHHTWRSKRRSVTQP